MSDQSKALRSKLCIEDVCQFDDGCGCLEAIDAALLPLRAEAERLREHNKIIMGRDPEEILDSYKWMKAEIERLTNDLVTGTARAQTLFADLTHARADVDFWKHSADKWLQQAMEYRKLLDHYEGRK